jgi:hypothetical protein
VGDHVGAAACFIVALVAQLVGVAGVIRAAVSVRKVKSTPLIQDNGDGSLTLNPSPHDALVNAQSLPIWALVVLVVGSVAGSLGSLLAL